MAEAGTDWPGFSSDCLGGLQRAGFPLSGCRAISWQPDSCRLLVSRLSYPASARRVPLPAVRFLSSSAVLAVAGGAAVRAGAGGRRRCGQVFVFPPVEWSRVTARSAAAGGAG